MVQPANLSDLPTDVDHHVGRLTTPFAAPPAGRSTSGPQAGVTRRTIGQVVVLEVAGRLSDVVPDLDRAIELALAAGPRGVVCDLTAVVEGAEPGAVEVLATVARHVHDWPGIPVVVACPDPLVRAALATHPLGEHLITATSLLSGLSAVLATPALAVAWLHLAPHPTALRASRDFVTRTLLDWRLGRVIRFARLVVGELVMSSMVNVGTDIDLSVAWNLGALRLTVGDHGPALLGQQPSAPGLHGRALTVVEGLSRAFGVLPTTDGGTVVWAVLDAAQPRPPANTPDARPATATRQSPRLTDALGLGGLPFYAETGRRRSGHRMPSPPTGACAP